MKIKDLKFYKKHFNLSRPYAISYKTTDAVFNFIVQLTTDSGLVGLGAASPSKSVTGETTEACEKALIWAKQWLKDHTLNDREPWFDELSTLMRQTPGALAAVDMALYDLLGKAHDKPLVEFLGPQHQELPTSITIGIKSIKETLIEADEYLERSFKIIKLKLGEGFETDLNRLNALYAHLKGAALIRVDMNQAYTPQTLKRFWDTVDKNCIEFIEQPLAANELESMHGLPDDLKKWIAADESLLNDQDAKKLVQPNPHCGIFNIKFMKCGGTTTACKIAQIANQNQIHLMWGCMDETRISISAALHTAFASKATRYIDLDGHLDLEKDVAAGGFTLEKGVMRPSSEPGLGVMLTESNF